MVKPGSAAPAFSRRRARRGGGSGFGHFGHQKDRGDHRSGAEDKPQLLAESVGVGVAGVGAGDNFGGHRGSSEDKLDARGVGEARGVAS